MIKKPFLQKFEAFCGHFAAYLSALILFVLFLLSLVVKMDILDISTLAEGKTLRLGATLPEVVGFVLLLSVLFLLGLLLRRLRTQKQANCLIAIATLAELAIALCWVFSQTIYPANDQQTVWQMAQALASGDFSAYTPNSYGYDYFRICPYQGLMAMVMEPFVRLFGAAALRVWSIFSAFCAAVSLWLLCALVKLLGGSPRVQALTAMLCLLFLPLPMYASFVYGTLPAPVLTLLGCYGLVRFLKNGKRLWLLLPFLLFPLASAAYQSTLIIVIAACIVCFFSGFSKGGRGVILHGFLSAALFICVIAFDSALQVLFFSRVPIPASSGMPASATVLMGIHVSNYYGPGGFDGSSWNLFTSNKFDTSAANKEAVNSIASWLSYDLTHPKELKFFVEKTAWQWLDPWFEALTMNAPSITVRTDAGWLAKAIGGGALFAPVQYLLRAMLTVVYLFAGIGTLSLDRKNHGSVRVQLLGIAFLGGFLFQLVWETKSRYCFPFFVCLLPLAAIGLTACEDALLQRFAHQPNFPK